MAETTINLFPFIVIAWMACGGRNNSAESGGDRLAARRPREVMALRRSSGDPARWAARPERKRQLPEEPGDPFEWD